MTECPKCNNRFRILKFNKNSRKIKCNNCNSEFEETTKTRWINSFIMVIPSIVVTFLNVEIDKILSELANAYSIKLVIIGALVAIWAVFICSINWPWNRYE